MNLGKTSCCFALIVLLAMPSTSQPVQRLQPLTAETALNKMAPGLNIGNTLEALPTETSWGNPKPNLAFMRAVKAAGFKCVRIPVAWSQYLDKSQRINPVWMAHVAAVVHMANQAGLYAIINVHWDGGWIQSTYAKRDAVNAKLANLWTQIATYFKNSGDGLLFAGTNEIGVEGVYGPPTPENAEVQNGFNQVFVDSVRATGGKNRLRWLVVQGYNTNIDDAVKSNAKMPVDRVKGRLMMEVHYYSPYNFTLNEKSNIWQWGKTASDPAATETWANEAYTDAEFQKMKESFVDKGVPVLLGEYACGMKPKFPGMDAYRKLWDSYVTQSAFNRGVIPIYWDTGGLFDRTTGQSKDRDVIRLIVQACNGRPLR